MLVQSTRFGRLKVEHRDLILLPSGLIGFETCRHWVLISDETNSHIAWLHSVGLANVALPVVSPRRFAPDYRVQITERELQRLKIRNEDQIFVLTVVSKNGMTLTTNLKSPILLNATRQLGVQVVCSDNPPLALPIGLLSPAAAVKSPQAARAVA